MTLIEWVLMKKRQKMIKITKNSRLLEDYDPHRVVFYEKEVKIDQKHKK